MATNNDSQINENLSATPAPRHPFCQRSKSDSTSFTSKLQNHFHEFLNASMDEHKTCLSSTFQKVFGKLKIFKVDSNGVTEGEKSIPLKTAGKD